MLLPLTSGHLESVSCSVIVRLFVTPWTAANQASLSFTISQSLLKFMSIKLVMPQPSHPLSSPSLPTFNLSQSISSCIRWPKYWCFSFNSSLSYEYSGWISFRIDWFDLLAVQGTLKSLLQHYSSEVSRCHNTNKNWLTFLIWEYSIKPANSCLKCYYLCMKSN